MFETYLGSKYVMSFVHTGDPGMMVLTALLCHFHLGKLVNLVALLSRWQLPLLAKHQLPLLFVCTCPA